MRIQTFAEGLFARLAHDLELECRNVEGRGERTDESSGLAALEIPIANIEVSGTLRSGRVDRSGLSPSDKADVLDKMRNDVFHARSGVVRAVGTLEGGRGRIEVIPPNGRTLSRSIDVQLQPEAKGVRVVGQVDLSLDALGSDPVKGPMNAFRVKDKVVVLFDLVFTEQP